MKTTITSICISIILLLGSLEQHAQLLDVTVVNTGDNKIQITGTATAPGFSASPNNAWASMNLTWRIPKAAAIPAPAVAPPAITPEITAEATAFTGAAPRDAFNNTGLDLTVFDLMSFGLPDDGYWYFQVTGTTSTVQNIATSGSTVLYEFATPTVWSCPGCVEILTADIPGLPISTTSFIDNAGLGADVLNLVTNMAPLPVQFLSFEAIANGDDVLLTWKVSDEQNVKGYHVQRSGDGFTWQVIGFVDFQASASLINQYELVDQHPLKGTNYYRISQEDIDGKRNYSVIRKVQRDNRHWNVKMYPVPVKDILNLNINVNSDERAVLKFTDALGRTIKITKLQLKQGEQTEKIPLSGLKAGMYYIEIQGTDHIWTGKFIKE